jgi:hypothetical protein
MSSLHYFLAYNASIPTVMTPRQPFIHLHIPKTAGTSLRAAYITAFGAERVAFMLPERTLVKTSVLPFKTEQLDELRRVAREQHFLPQFSTMVQRINKNQYYDAFKLEAVVEHDVSVATGHIKHTDITDSVAQLDVTTVVRDPLERIWSHYAHWQEAQGTMWWHDGSIGYSDSVTFEKFASDPLMTNYQSAYLGSLACAVIGIADALPQFMEQVGVGNTPAIPQLNTGSYRSMPKLDVGFIRDFTENNRVDYELYQQALQANN